LLEDTSNKGGFFMKPTKISFKSYVKIAIALLVIYAVFLIVSRNITSSWSYISDLILILTNVLVIIILYFAAQRSKSYNGWTNIAWWIFFVSQILWLLGNVSWALQDFGFVFKLPLSINLLTYAIYIAILSVGIILLPGSEISTIASLRRVTDIGIVMVIIFLSLWSLIIEPFFNLTESNYGTFLLVFVFLVLEFGLLSTIISVVLENAGQIRNRPVSYLLASALVQVVAASLFVYRIVQGQYVSDTLIDFMWMVSIVLLGLAGLLQIIRPPPKEMRDCSQQAWYMNLPLNPYIPTIFIVIAYLVVLYIDYTNPYFLDEVLLVAGIIIFLVISRQILDVLDLKRTNQAVKIKELKILQANKKLKNKQKKLEQSLQEKKVLLKEIHHRVKNNMQIISSLLSLQRGCVEGDETINVLRDSQGRVRSMAMIHENLYQSPTLSNINFKNYIKELVKVILITYGYQGIENKLEVEDINLDIDTAIPCGLIINELVTNSVKYAFPHGKGTINIKLKSFQDELELIIADNGIGLPQDFDYKNTNTLGLQLVDSLVRQLNGQITLERSQGTEFKIKFKEWD
jgi:two-component sensor histidine kinase